MRRVKMTNDTLKLGFVGGGINSAIGMTHKIAAQMDNKFNVSAGCFSRNQETNRKTAEQWGVPYYYPSYQALLDSKKKSLDAIVVLTPTDSHTDIILDALDAGVPVICEKTLTNSIQDAQRIQHAVAKTNGFLLTTYNYTGYPMVRELQHMIQTGKLGNIIQVNVQMPQESFIRLNKHGGISEPQAWRLKDNAISTLSLDLGTHLSNMVSFLTGEHPLEVIAMQNRFGHHNVVDNLVCMIKYNRNIDCQMWYSKAALGHKNGLKIEVYGDKGSASWYQMNPEFLQYNDNTGKNITLDRSSNEIEVANQERYNRFKSGHPAGFIEAFANHYADIHTALQHYKQNKTKYLNPFVFDVHASFNELLLMQAIEHSIENKHWEKIHYA